jgi:hypothetical protein
MVRRVGADQNLPATAAQKSGAIVLLPQASLVQPLEDELLASGEEVVTTRSQNPRLWRTLLGAGLIVLVHAPAKTWTELVTLDENGEDFSTQLFPSEASVEEILQTIKHFRAKRAEQDDREF